MMSPPTNIPSLFIFALLIVVPASGALGQSTPQARHRSELKKRISDLQLRLSKTIGVRKNNSHTDDGSQATHSPDPGFRDLRTTVNQPPPRVDDAISRRNQLVAKYGQAATYRGSSFQASERALIQQARAQVPLPDPATRQQAGYVDNGLQLHAPQDSMRDEFTNQHEYSTHPSTLPAAEPFELMHDPNRLPTPNSVERLNNPLRPRETSDSRYAAYADQQPSASPSARLATPSLNRQASVQQHQSTMQTQPPPPMHSTGQLHPSQRMPMANGQQMPIPGSQPSVPQPGYVVPDPMGSYNSPQSMMPQGRPFKPHDWDSKKLTATERALKLQQENEELQYKLESANRMNKQLRETLNKKVNEERLFREAMANANTQLEQAYQENKRLNQKIAELEELARRQAIETERVLQSIKEELDQVVVGQVLEKGQGNQ